MVNHDGSGSASIYGKTFHDESYMFHHDHAGLLSMANSGVDTNGSQFFITMEPSNFLDYKHVVFGRVAEGMDVVNEIESYGKADGAATAKIVIEDCGALCE